MAQNSRISWCDNTWNPWQGCQKMSPACGHCYMFSWQARYGKQQNVVTRSAETTFYAPRRWHNQLAQGTYLGERHFSHTLLVFTCSLSDFFIAEADPWRPEAWEIIRQTPNLTYQILTKRPERIADHLPPDWGEGYPNVWLGVSVENRRWLSRLEVLRQVPASVRFASFEPLLKDLGDLTPWLSQLDWAIVGGESGAGYRPMDITWLARVVQQCGERGIPVWVKQDSAFKNGQQGRLPDVLWCLKQFPRFVHQGSVLYHNTEKRREQRSHG